MTIHQSPYGDIALRDCSITERIFEGLSPTPEAIALIEGPTGRTITAAELMADIRSVAGGLTSRGVGAGHTVALMTPNIPEFCTIFHGIAWAGGTATTVNPAYTAPEIRHQLIDSGAELLITVSDCLDAAQAAIEGTGVTEIVVIGDEAARLGDLAGSPIETQVPVDLDTHAVALPYSSGTTGMPKGVMLSHRNLVVNVDQLLTVAKIDRGEITPAFLPFFHIYGLEVLINVYLASGAGLATLPRFDLELFLQLAQDHKSRRLWVVPPVAIALAKHPVVDRFDLSSLVQVNSAAAPLGADLARAVSERLGCPTTQAYGMTELSPASHVEPLSAPRPGSVGKIVPGTFCRIVDHETGRDVAGNAEGEIWVKGPQVMMGYLNNPEATAATIDEEDWLQTGDVGYFDDDGYLFISDRVKELIKTKGFQVAPAELEAALITHPQVADAAVIGLPDDDAGEVPVAFLVASGDARPSLEDLQSYLREQLAGYKQIHQATYVDEIPKSASGKILRRVIREGLTA